MKLRVTIKEAVAPEEISARKQAAIQNINNELRGLDLDTLDLQQLQAILTSIEVAKGDQPAENLASLEEKSAVSKKMTKSDEKKREKIVKGMKGSKKDFEKRYGKDAEDVMCATATKIAMKKKKK